MKPNDPGMSEAAGKAWSSTHILRSDLISFSLFILAYYFSIFFDIGSILKQSLPSLSQDDWQ